MAERKIFIFSDAIGRGPCTGYALAEDGVMLSKVWCSCDDYVPRDLGAYKSSMHPVRELYAAHFPDGFETVFVPWRNVVHHKELQAALNLNMNVAKAL